jgi:hypothetical protein
MTRRVFHTLLYRAMPETPVKNNLSGVVVIAGHSFIIILEPVQHSIVRIALTHVNRAASRQ